MKNFKHIIVTTVALISLASSANLLQPLNPTSEDAPLRLSIAATGGANVNQHGFGMSGVGGGMAITHNVGYDFSYDLALAYKYSNYSGRIFTERTKKSEGNRLDAELSLRYFPEVLERFNVGLNVGVGLGRQFGESGKSINDAVSFGDLSLKTGPLLSYGFSDDVSMYFAVYYSLHNIRFIKDDISETLKKRVKESTNWSGLDLPLGLWFALSDNSGLFVEANTRFINLLKGAKYFQEEVTLGMSFAI